MIYSSSSIVINSSVEALWNRLEKFIKLPEQGNFVSECIITKTDFDGFERSLTIKGESEITERVFLIKKQYKIIMQIENHPLLIGDTIFQIVTSNREELMDRKLTLCGVLTWRMRPGIIEAPGIKDKQEMIEDLLSSIAEM